MTLIWDTGINEGVPAPAFENGPLGPRNNRTVSWCEADGTLVQVYLRDDGAGNTLFCYAYGNDNAWTEEILVRSNAATGRLGIQAVVHCFSICVHQTGGANDHVHFMFDDTITANVYHTELLIPTAPHINGNWSTWGGPPVRYQVITALGAAAHSSIDTDSTGHPIVVYQRSVGGGQYQAYVNYGNGANHAFTPASELALTGNIAHELFPVVVCVDDDARDIYIFVNNGQTIQERYCDKAGLPTLIGSWAAWNTVINFVGIGSGNAGPPSAYYWYDGGGAFAQIMVAAREVTLGRIRTNWYDEGNVNGWGGGWRNANGTLEGVLADAVQISQVDANDFALTYVPFGAGIVRFGFADYGTPQYDFTGSTFLDATNSAAREFSAEERGRESDDLSFGLIHLQTGVDFDFMFDLVRVNVTPTAVSLDPDSGDREDESNIIVLSWTFTDPGQAQTQWHIQVDEFGAGFVGPIWDSGVQAGADASDNLPALTLAFNIHYEWRIMVWDDEVGDEYDPYSDSDWEE